MKNSPIAPQSPPSRAPLCGLDRFSATTKSVLFVAGNLLPSVGLFVMLGGSPQPASWQSGQFHDYATFLLSSETAALFYPFFFVAIACFTMGLFRPYTLGRYFWLRAGIYSGILLGLQYTVVLGIVLFKVDRFHLLGILTVAVAIPFAAISLVAVTWIAWRLLLKLKRFVLSPRHNLWCLILLGVAAPCLALLCGHTTDVREGLLLMLLGPSVIAVVATPIWMTVAYAVLAYQLDRLHRPPFRFGLSRLLLLVSWFAAFMASWRFAVVRTLEAYAALPTTPPSNCYVATAAAYGHSRVVRSWQVPCDGQDWRRVNAQLAYLKCGEFAMQTLAPRTHCRMRRWYDRRGPEIASLLTSPIVADLVYLGLKPLEWLTQLMLRCLHPQAMRIARQMYLPMHYNERPRLLKPSLGNHQDACNS